jgi:hypothetical protein
MRGGRPRSYICPLSGFLIRRVVVTLVAMGAFWGVQVGTSWGFDQARWPFQDPVEYASSGLSQIKAVDMNGDGHLDLVGRRGTDVVVEIGDGTGAFADPQTIASDVSPYYHGAQIALGDADGDGLQDIAVRRPDGSGGNEIAVLLNDGNGLDFTTTDVIPTASSTTLWALAPFGADSDADLLTLNRNSVGNPYLQDATISVLPGNGDGTFTAPVDSPIDIPVPHETAAIYLTLVTSADLDGDGLADVLLGGSVYSQATDSFAMKGRADGTFDSPVRISGARGSSDITIGDLNGDGRPDLITAGTQALRDPIYYTFNLGSLSFSTPQVFYAADRPPWANLYPPVALADFDGDGRTDVVSPTDIYQPVGISYGSSDGTFAPMEAAALAPYSPYRNADAVAGDFNEDGLPDVAVGGSSLAVLLHKSASEYPPPPDNPPPPGGGGDTLGDVATSGTGLHVLKHHFPKTVRQLLKKGVTATVSCDIDCNLLTRLVAHEGAVKALHLNGATIARTRTAIKAGEVVKVRVIPTGKAAGLIAAGKSFAYGLRFDSTPAA